MSELPEAVRAAIDGLTEDQAWQVLWALESRFDWTASVWGMRDVLVTYEAEGDEDDVEYEYDAVLTDAERDAVASTWEWRKGIAQSASEHVAELNLVPSLKRHADGTFTVRTSDEDHHYAADGRRIEEGK